MRRSSLINGARHDTLRRWQYDLLGQVRAERTGWSFDWYGEHVSTPVAYLVHTDGRFGVRASGSFLEACPSINHLIESHALMDQVSSWEPLSSNALERWAPAGVADGRAERLVEDLPIVAEASGPCERWWCSENVAVRVFHRWTDEQPRPMGVMAWSRQSST